MLSIQYSHPIEQNPLSQQFSIVVEMYPMTGDTCVQKTVTSRVHCTTFLMYRKHIRYPSSPDIDFQIINVTRIEGGDNTP